MFGFSSENDEIQTGLSFLDSVDELKASDIPDKIENIFKERRFDLNFILHNFGFF